MFLFLTSLYFFIGNSFSLVGGGLTHNIKQVVELKNDHSRTYCSGAVVGLSPLTVLTANHCILNKELKDINVLGIRPQKIIQSDDNLSDIYSSRLSFPVWKTQYYEWYTRSGLLEKQSAKGIDIAVLVFDSQDSFGEDLKQAFTLEAIDIDLEKYRGKMSLCGSGREINSANGVQVSGKMKCGESYFIPEQSSDKSLLYLFSKKYLLCKQWASVDQLAMLNYATAINGDSGGPLFIFKNNKFFLLALLKSGLVNTDISLKNEPGRCGVEYGESFRSDWILFGKKNQMIMDFLKGAVSLGANINGINTNSTN